MIALYYAVEIAQKIKYLAKEKEITIKDMLLEIKLNKNSINTLSNGSMIQCDSLAKIADYLNCSVDYLLGRTSQRNYPTDSFTLTPNEQTVLDIFQKLSLLDQHAAIKHLQFLLSESSDKQSIPTNTTAVAARNNTSDTPPEINNNDLETTISQSSEQE